MAWAVLVSRLVFTSAAATTAEVAGRRKEVLLWQLGWRFGKGTSGCRTSIKTVKKKARKKSKPGGTLKAPRF